MAAHGEAQEAAADAIEAVLRRPAAGSLPWTDAEKRLVCTWLVESRLELFLRTAHATLGRQPRLKDAADIAHDALHDLWKYLDNYDPSRSQLPRIGEWGKAAFVVYARQLMRNSLIKHFGNVRKRPEVVLEDQHAPPAVAADPTVSTEITELLGFLPLREREVLIRVGLNGETMAEAGAEMDVLAGAARITWFRARHRFLAIQAWTDTFEPRRAGRVTVMVIGEGVSIEATARRLAIAVSHAIEALRSASTDLGKRRVGPLALLHEEVRGRFDEAIRQGESLL